MHSYNTKKRIGMERGFTLVETLVAVTILLVVITGPMTIASNGMRNSFYAGDQTTAVYLAQEAIEAIQKLRDDNALAAYNVYKTPGGDYSGLTTDWRTSLNANCKDADGCDVDYSSGSPLFNRDCTTSNLCLLKVDTDGTYSNRVYGYTSGWSNSIFTRRIKVGALSGGAVPVTVTVSWNASIFGNPTDNARSVVLQTYIYDQYKRYE